ncbi:metallophosphoesterase [uncultured Eubacterium sp.]|uniref:metallophosphoesterase family protein n=1 Tax=uncultured Eubacterium sp. TaxID=165185 RepID=UPI00259905AB|nr:metallophosphoesterase [uncultured Eubacterium sp.]
MIRFTVFGDLHFDEVLDGDRRVSELVEHIKATNPDFVVSLGDLCNPVKENEEMVIKKFKQIGFPIYHTIGNHETDDCCLEEALKFLSMDTPYYSFLFGDIKFIVLNSCYYSVEGQESAYYGRNYKKENSLYPIIPKKEKEWLERELSDGKKYIIFSHHSLVNNHMDRGIYNKEEIRDLFREKDVLLCMNGHDHGDNFVVVDDIPYYTLNSATYAWCGAQIMSSEKLKEMYGYLNGMLLYKQALCVDVEIDDKEIRIQGMNGNYLSVTPEDIELFDYKWNGVSIKAQTSSVVIPILQENFVR